MVDLAGLAVALGESVSEWGGNARPRRLLSTTADLHTLYPLATLLNISSITHHLKWL
jgi:hypothetical protein